MILYVDDEPERTKRWREALEKVSGVITEKTASAALGRFADAAFMADVRLVVLDLQMHTTGSLTDRQTGYGRLTGDALRRQLRATGWRGPVVILTNARDDATRERVEADGDHFRRKPDCPPSELAELAKKLLGN